jgi:hypothetical protein
MDKQEKLFPNLSGTRIDEPLSAVEMEGLWDSVHRAIHRRKRARWPRVLYAAAAAVVLSLGLWAVQDRYAAKPPTFTMAGIVPESTEPPPMIAPGDGNPAMIYESESHGVKIAFVVDKSLKWE